MAHLQNVNQLWKLLLLKVTINEKSLNVVRAETPPLDSAAARLVKKAKYLIAIMTTILESLHSKRK